MNQLQLGLSGFHLGFTSFDTFVSKIALGLHELAYTGKHLLQGDPGQAVASLGRAAWDIGTSPLAPVINAIRGHKGLKEWNHPGSQGAEIGYIVDAIAGSGGRASMESFYRTHVGDKVMSAYRQGNIVGTLARVPGLMVELPTRAIMEGVVPRQKFGVTMDLLHMEMKNNPGISRDALMEKGRKIWASADNRMGQLVYDNLFWHKLPTDIAMASIRSDRKS